MTIRRTYDAKLIGIYAKFQLQLESVFQCFTGVLVLQHIRCFRHQAQVGFIPQRVKAGELIIGGQKGVALTITFDLGDFVEWLPACAFADVLRIQ